MTRAADSSMSVSPTAGHAAAGSGSGPVPGPLGRLLTIPYTLAINHRNRGFDKRRGVIYFDRPVISVGNLSVGGTGKTPMVAYLARAVFDGGHFPCIAMRGYKAKPGQESDEAATYARALPHVPVVARANRTGGLIDLFATPQGEKIDCIILDDGFQHRQIGRELDLVLIDATRSPFDDRVLPAGWLREPITSLARASGVIITHAEAVDPSTLTTLQTNIDRAGIRLLSICRHSWTTLAIHENGEEREESVNWLARRRVLAICAIGNPHPFLRAVEQAVGGTLVGAVVLRDHDPYNPPTVARILAQARDASADLIVTTEKDWSKLRAGDWPLPIVRPRLHLQFDSGEEALRELVLDTVARGAIPLEDEPQEPQEPEDEEQPSAS